MKLEQKQSYPLPHRRCLQPHLEQLGKIISRVANLPLDHASYVVCCVALRTEHFQHAARQPLYVAMMLSLQLGLLYVIQHNLP